MDFDSFLEGAARQEAEKAENEHYNEALNRRLMDEIAARNLPRVIDSDPEIEAQFQHELTRHFVEIFESDVHTSPENYPTDPEVRDEVILTLAKEHVAQTVLNQKHLFASIQMLITAYESAATQESIPDHPKITKAKKQLTADLLIIERYESDDPWITFLNDVVPGESLDSANPQDEPYLLVAYEKLANQQEAERELREKLEGAYSIAGINFERPTEQDVKLAAAVSNMVIRGSRNSSAENAAAERQAQLDEIGRDNDLDSETIRRIIAYIEDTYPI